MFDFIHLKQEKGWRLKGAIIVIHTSFFSAQREHAGIILSSERISITTQA